MQHQGLLTSLFVLESLVASCCIMGEGCIMNWHVLPCILVCIMLLMDNIESLWSCMPLLWQGVFRIHI